MSRAGSGDRLERAKRAAADHAAGLVPHDATIGLGSGSTAAYFIEALGRRVADGLAVTGVPSSSAAAAAALRAGVPVTERPARPIDLAVDGADEVSPALDLIKGYGGALAREKLVAVAARRFVVIVDEGKLVDRLGRGKVPVEVLPFLWETTATRLAVGGAAVTRRADAAGQPVVTDNGNFIVDLVLPAPMEDPAGTAALLDTTVGVVAHGLFLGMVSSCVVGAADGRVRVLDGNG